MKEYRSKIANIFIMGTGTLAFIILFILIAMIAWDDTEYLIKLIMVMSVVYVVSMIMYAMIQRKYIIKTDRYKLYVQSNTSISRDLVVPNIFSFSETTFKWEAITSITSYREILFDLHKDRIKICTIAKSAIIPIKYFRNYKELLNTIIDKTKNNEHIFIDQKVLDLTK